MLHQQRTEGISWSATLPAGSSSISRSRRSASGPAQRPVSLSSLKQSDIDDAFAAALSATPIKPAVYVLYFRSEEAGMFRVAARSRRSDRRREISDQCRYQRPSATPMTPVPAPTIRLVVTSRREHQAMHWSPQASPMPSSTVDYHGANNPLVPNPPGGHELSNRRVEITVRELDPNAAEVVASAAFGWSPRFRHPRH